VETHSDTESFLYLARWMLPDIAFGEKILNLDIVHVQAVKRCFTYLKGAKYSGRIYTLAAKDLQGGLEEFVESVWAGCFDTRKQTGHVLTLH